MLFKVSAPEPTLEVPMTKAFASVTVTLFAPELLNKTEPVKSLLALFKVITFAPTLKLALPALAAWVMAPLCVKAPPAMTIKLPEQI